MEYKEFLVLAALEEAEDYTLTQRELAEKTGLSVGTVNGVVATAGEAGWIADGKLTAAGLSALEPYRVRRAVFIAAGFGSRLVPITLNTPKPLVRVRGTRIIDALLDAVTAAGIEEIYIVRGYYGEQFDALLYKHPNIKFIENPMYGEANNISSLMAARYLLQGSYVIESDLLLSNPALIKKYQYHSNYLAIPMERSDDWCFDVNKKGVIGRKLVGTSRRPSRCRAARSAIGTRWRSRTAPSTTRSTCASAAPTTSWRSTRSRSSRHSTARTRSRAFGSDCERAAGVCRWPFCVLRGISRSRIYKARRGIYSYTPFGVPLPCKGARID